MSIPPLTHAHLCALAILRARGALPVAQVVELLRPDDPTGLCAATASLLVDLIDHKFVTYDFSTGTMALTERGRIALLHRDADAAA